VGIESQENAVQSLRYVKDILKINPEIIVHDLSPNLISATTEVFGEDKIAFDPYHVMQNLNRAILKDLGRIRKLHFSAEKKDLDRLKENIVLLQRSFSENVKKIPKISSITIENTHKIAKQCQIIAENMLKLCNIRDTAIFFYDIRNQLEEYRQCNELPILSFSLSLIEKLPKYIDSIKAMNRIKSEI
jgi:hypothetical protein